MSSEENLAPTLLGVFVTGAILSTISVALRLWVRGWIVRKVGLDDWVVLCSLVRVYSISKEQADTMLRLVFGIRISWLRKRSLRPWTRKAHQYLGALSSNHSGEDGVGRFPAYTVR